jgi:TRAP-type C4-dicarboxylate transport system substrate-binding protein
VYSRAHRSRTVTLVVTLVLTAVSTSVGAREFRAADTQNENFPAVQALLYKARLIADCRGGGYQFRAFHSRQPGEEKETVGRACSSASDLNRGNVAADSDCRPCECDEGNLAEGVLRSCSG